MELSEKRMKEEILYNEEKLLNNDFRENAEVLKDLIENNYIEINETGVQNRFQPGQTFEKIDGVIYITNDESQLIDLSANCKLLIYGAVKVKKNTRTMINCSSIWKRKNDNWKVIFQQRTNR